jgi:hypothetical protein
MWNLISLETENAPIAFALKTANNINCTIKEGILDKYNHASIFIYTKYIKEYIPIYALEIA